MYFEYSSIWIGIDKDKRTRANTPMQPTPLCGPKIVAILRLSYAARLQWPLMGRAFGGSAVGSAYDGAKATTDSMRMAAQFRYE
jgi:hypothetical protein